MQAFQGNPQIIEPWVESGPADLQQVVSMLHEISLHETMEQVTFYIPTMALPLTYICTTQYLYSYICTWPPVY